MAREKTPSLRSNFFLINIPIAISATGHIFTEWLYFANPTNKDGYPDNPTKPTAVIIITHLSAPVSQAMRTHDHEEPK